MAAKAVWAVAWGVVVWLTLLAPALAQTQSVLPNGMTQFVDGNGTPYAGGHVYMYVPQTTTPKTTYQDPYGHTPNANPITLDANGRAVVWGNGVYRQVLQNALGVVVWDQLTYASPVGVLGNVGVFWYGTALGTANAITLTGPAGFNATDGQIVGFLAQVANTGSVTVNAGGYGAVLLEKNTSSGPAVLTGGEIAGPGNIYYAGYSASANAFVLVNNVPTVPAVTVAGGQAVPGVVCDGATDNTAAITNAIAGATGGAWFILPAGTCKINGTVTLGQSRVRLSGQGWGATTISCATATLADCFVLGTNPNSAVCIGLTAPAGCGQLTSLTLDNFTITSARTGGFCFDVNGATNVLIRDIVYSCWWLAQVHYANNLVFDNLNGSTTGTSGYAINLYQAITTGTGAGWYRSDVVSFRHVVVNAQRLGAGCLNWDGMIQTVQVQTLQLLQCGDYGMVVTNSQHDTQWWPAFLQADDLEIEGATKDALAINAGRFFHCVNCYINQFYGNDLAYYPLTVHPDTGFSDTAGVYLDNSEVHDAYGAAAYLDAKNITISNTQFFDTNHKASGSIPVVVVGPAAENVTVVGGSMGQNYGDPNQPTYGVVVQADAGPVSFAGVSFSGALTKSINNLSVFDVGWSGGFGYNNVMNAATTCAAHTAC